MAWTLNNIRIFTQKMPDDSNQIIARLQPLAGGTVTQTFGYENTTYKISAYVVGSGDVASLRALTTTGLTYALVAPWGTIGNFYVKSVSADPQITVCQTLRTDLPTTSIVYMVDIGLQ